MTQKDESKKKIAEHKSAIVILSALQGKTVTQMTKKEQEDFMTALGQIAGGLDETGKVKEK